MICPGKIGVQGQGPHLKKESFEKKNKHHPIYFFHYFLTLRKAHLENVFGWVQNPLNQTQCLQLAHKIPGNAWTLKMVANKEVWDLLIGPQFQVLS